MSEIFVTDHTKKDNDWKADGNTTTIPPFYYLYTEDPKEAYAELEEISKNNEYLGMDTEANSLEWEMPDTEQHGFSVAGKDKALYIHGKASLDQDVLNLLSSIINKQSTIWFNISFDLHILEKYGVVYDSWDKKLGHDVYIMSRLNNRGDTRGGHSLKANAFTYLGHENLPDFKKLLNKYGDISAIPIEILARYGAFDARITYDLFMQLRTILQREVILGKENKTLWDYYLDEHLEATEVTYRMERNGMYIDKDYLSQINDEAKDVVDGIGQWWERVTGTLLQSPQQKAFFFFDLQGHDVISKTGTGSPSTEESVLQILAKEKNDVWADLYVNTIAPASKILSTYTTPILERIVRIGEPRIHGSFSIPRARTGRAASSDPNLQNIPSKGIWGNRMRKSFCAPPDCVFVRSDYSQLELRCLAHMTQDPEWIEMFMEGGDPHQLTADTVGVIRNQAKVINFGIIYGMSAKALAGEIKNWGAGDISEAEAQQYIDSFLGNFEKTSVWMQRVRDYARQVGYVQTILGRKRWLPAIDSRNSYDRGSAERKAVNTVIQGSAADIMNRGAIFAMQVIDEYNRIHESKIEMAAMVHDEIAVYVPETEDMCGVARMIGTALESAGNYVNLRVPLVAEPMIGNSWLEVKD